MAKFSFYVFKLIIYSFLVAFLIQYVADSGLKKMDNSIYSDWNKILDGNLNSDILILGSSRGYVSYDPEIIQKTTGLSSYNLSINAGSYNIQGLKFDAYLDNNKFPKVIIQNIDLTHFSKTKIVPEEFQFLPYLCNKKLFRELNHLNPDYRWKYHIPLYKYNHHKSFLVKGILSFFGKKYSISPTINGFAPKNPKFKKDEHNLTRLRYLRSDSSNISKFRKKTAIVKEFLNNYKTDSVKIFLVWAPEYKERLDIIKSITIPLKQDLNKIVSDMPGVYFLDFSDDILNQREDFFYDTFHLNKKGAALFSTKLSIEIDRILKN